MTLIIFLQQLKMSKNLVQIILSDDLRNLKVCMFRSIKIQSTQQKKGISRRNFYSNYVVFTDSKKESNFPTFPCAWLSILWKFSFYHHNLHVSYFFVIFPCTLLYSLDFSRSILCIIEWLKFINFVTLNCQQKCFLIEF